MLVANAGLPGSGGLHSFSRRGDRPRARRQPARADAARARALTERWSRAAAGTCVFMSSLAGKAGCARHVGLLGDEVRPARLRARAARGPAPQGRRRLGDPARASSATRACSPTPAPSSRPSSGPSARRTSRAAVVKAIEHNRAELDVAPLPLRAGALLASLAPGPVGTIQRKLGAAATPSRSGAGRRASASAAPVPPITIVHFDRLGTPQGPRRRDPTTGTRRNGCAFCASDRWRGRSRRGAAAGAVAVGQSGPGQDRRPQGLNRLLEAEEHHPVHR